MDAGIIQWGFSAAGVVVGLAVGATGVGGGSLMTPILILFYGVSPAVAVGTDLLYASISKAYGVFLHLRRGTLPWGIVLRMAAGSVPAALLAIAWLDHVGPSAKLNQIIQVTLAVAVIATATFTIFQNQLKAQMQRFNTAEEFVTQHQALLTVVSGVVIGAVVAISSVGAGVIGMMVLIWLYPKEPPMKLVGADLAHAVLITGIAGAGHARIGGIDYSLLVSLLVGALPGIYLGSLLGFRLDAKRLKQIISGILIVVGLLTLYKVMK